MKKVYIIPILILGFITSSFAQVSFEANNYPNIGDRFPLVTYFNSPEEEAVLMNLFENNGMLFNSIDMFSEHRIDTVSFLNPNTVDTANLFTDATHLLSSQGVGLFIKKDDQKVETLGFFGDFMQTGMSVRMSDPLKIMEFPTNATTSFTDNGSGEQAMPVSNLEPVIPAEYYTIFAAMFDSVKLMVSTEIQSEIINTENVTIDLPVTNNGNFNCLKEFQKQINFIDIYVRSSFSGAWSPLASAPGIGENLPFELPMKDTTYTLRWWTPEYGLPLAEIQTNEAQDSVYNLRLHYKAPEGIMQQNYSANINIYPNPASNDITIDCSNIDSQCQSIKITTFEGKYVKQFFINNKITKFAIDFLPNGAYIIQFMDKNNCPLGYKKLVVNHK